MTWNSIERTFVKKTSMPDPVKSLLYISSVTAWVAPELLKALSILWGTTLRRYAVDREELKTILGIRKKYQLSLSIS